MTSASVPLRCPDHAAWRRRRVLALCGAAALAGLAGPVGAHTVPASRGPVQVAVLDRGDDSPLRVWRDHGTPVVAGRPGARYAVRLSNTSGERVLAVVAIDGVNVVTGETAASGQRGYVLEPWQSTTVTGWRKSSEEVAAFEFTALADSYAARTGRPQDVGVIGVAVFREAPAPELDDEPTPVLRDGAARSQAAPRAAYGATPPPAADGADGRSRKSDLAAAGVAAPAERLGTGHGARETSVARTTTFVRASTQPAQRVEIRYDSVDNLVAAGIIPARPVAVTRPRPFPADPPIGYVQDPPAR